jgi:hypothetical protein
MIEGIEIQLIFLAFIQCLEELHRIHLDPGPESKTAFGLVGKGGEPVHEPGACFAGQLLPDILAAPVIQIQYEFTTGDIQIFNDGGRGGRLVPG